MRAGVRRRVSSLVIILLLLCPGYSRGAGLETRSPEELALGADRVVLAIARGFARQTGWSVRVGQTRPFGLAALATDSFRVAWRSTAWGGIGSAASVRSQFGHEFAARTDVVIWHDDWFGVAMGAGYHGVRLAGFEPAHSYEFALRVAGAIADGYWVGYAAVVDRDHTSAVRGVRVAMNLAVQPSHALTMLFNLELGRTGRLSASAGARLQAFERLALGAGYQAGNSSFGACATARVHRLGLSVGAEVHPLLGVTQQVWLGWGDQ